MDRAAVEAAVSPERAVEAVREAFVAHARGEWSMPPKVYVTNYPAGDFRAMPALGGGHALLKWITSFPGNPARGLADGGGHRARLGRVDGRAAGGARRGVGDGAPHRRGGSARRGDARPRRRGDRSGRSARASTAARRRARSSRAAGRSRCGTSTCPRGGGRSGARLLGRRRRARRRSRRTCS